MSIFYQFFQEMEDELIFPNQKCCSEIIMSGDDTDIESIIKIHYVEYVNTKKFI